MDWFKGEFSKSNIISGFLAIAIWGAIIYLSVCQLAVPEILYFGGASVIGFFFGAKTGAITAQAEARKEALDKLQ